MNAKLNQAILENYGNMHTRIEHLVWIAMQIESRVFEDEIIWAQTADEWHEIFPDIPKEYLCEAIERDEISDLLIDYKKTGFICEVAHQQMKDFSFKKDGSFRSCCSSSVFTTQILYAESMADLYMRIHQADREHWESMLDKARKEKKVERT